WNANSRIKHPIHCCTLIGDIASWLPELSPERKTWNPGDQLRMQAARIWLVISGGPMDAVTRLLQGSIDLHIHPSPSLFPRRLDAVDAAQQAAQAGMRAIVIKSHHHTTAPELVPLKTHDLKNVPVQVFGGVALNSYVGGLNPYIVDMTLRLGGKIVW